MWRITLRHSNGETGFEPAMQEPPRPFRRRVAAVDPDIPAPHAPPFAPRPPVLRSPLSTRSSISFLRPGVLLKILNVQGIWACSRNPA